MKNAILEEATSLSKSIIWKLQRDFFHSQGINAWQNQVPFYVTSNNYFSNEISKIIQRYIFEGLIQNVINPQEPIYIIELGTGAGQFSYKCIKEFQENSKHFEAWQLDIRYVMTDFTESNIKFWNSNAQFKSLVDSKTLDFAQFDCDNPQEFITLNHKWEFKKNSQKNPIILITNYVYDSITHDLFRFNDGKIEEGKLRVETHKNNLKNGQVQNLEKLICEFEYTDTTLNHYQDPRLNSILEFYKKRIFSGVVTIPIGAIKCIDFFNSLSNNGVFNITSDKGHAKYESFENTTEIYVAFHASFSLMVNFHALGLLSDNYTPGTEDAGLKTCLLFFNHKNSSEFIETKQSLTQGLNTYSSEDFLNIKNLLINQSGNMRLADHLSVLKLCDWDFKIFQALQQDIMKTITGLSNTQAEMFKIGLPKLLKSFYLLQNTNFPHFDFGRIYHFCKEYENAILHYEESILDKEELASSYFNIGLCHYALLQYGKAHQSFKKCREIENDFENIDDWIERTEPIS